MAARGLVLVLLLLGPARPGKTLDCLQDGDAIETRPLEVNIMPGQQFSIACLIDPTQETARGKTAADLYFTRDAYVSREVPTSQYTMLNSTTMVMVDSLQTAVHYQYTCRIRGGGIICASNVNVGQPPQDVTNFRCISYNWKNITCSWDVQYNAVQSEYQLQYRLNTYYDSSDPSRREQWAVCPDYDNDLLRTSCTMTDKTQPTYRHGAAFYNFTMNITNALGQRLQWMGVVDNFAIVLPDKPKSVKNVSVTTNSVELETEVSEPMEVFPRPLNFSVSYTSPWDLEPTFVNASSMSAQLAKRRLLVTGLSAYTEYTFAVSLCSSVAQRADMWSPPAYVTARTLPTVPAAAPTLDVGSFQLLDAASSRTVWVYWSQIAGRLQAGPDFGYCCSAWSAAGRPLPLVRPDKATETYARFTGVSLNATVFRVRACNRLGTSRQSSSLTVPARRRIGERPHSVTVVISRPGRYQLVWRHPTTPPPHSFTLFWCRQRRDLPYQCQGQLDMKRVPGNIREYSLSLAVDSEYQFAVSANFLGDDGVLGSSGMVWSRCPIVTSRDDQQIVNLSVESRGSDYLVLTWNNDCSSLSTDVVYNFTVFYCKEVEGNCVDEEQSVRLSGPFSGGLRVADLLPYTSYLLSMALLTDGRQTLRSSPPLVARTQQSKPSTPPIITDVVATSNTSLQVRWSPPTRPNGPLKNYLVHVDSRELQVSASQTTATISNLQPYTAYPVSVQACTKDGCSPRSPQVTNRTQPGVPGQMEPLRTQLLNTSAVLLHWRPPRQPAGLQPVFYLRTVSEEAGTNYTSTVRLPAGQLQMERLVRPCRPGRRSQRHVFWVRAVTELPGGGRLAGPWSEPVQQSCVLAAGWPPAAVVGLVVGGCVLLALLAVGVFCLCSRTKRKWVKMRDISVNLPSGLERPEKPPVTRFAGADRQPVASAAADYGRLVSQAIDTAGGGTSTLPLLQEDSLALETTDTGETPLSVTTDSNSCSSSATNYTDSGAEPDKVGSPIYSKAPWTGGHVKLAPYVQVGGPGTHPPPGPLYTKFSPYVDAKAIQALMARSMDALPGDAALRQASHSVPDVRGGADARPLSYGQISQRSSTVYVSMTSDDGLPAAGRRSPPQKAAGPAGAYVALGPPPPSVSAAGFPPYVLAGLATGDGGGGGADRGAACGGQVRPRAAAGGGYVTHAKVRPASIELHHLAANRRPSGQVTASEPVLSPKKLSVVASARDPYCRVVTAHHGAAQPGPDVSML